MVGSMESDDIPERIERGARTLAGRRFVTIGEAVDGVIERLRRQVLRGGGEEPAAGLAARETPGQAGRASEDR